MPTARRPHTVPARTVRTSDGARAYLPEVALVSVTTLAPFYCAACSKHVPARGEAIVSSRTTDVTGVFDVWFCGCRLAGVSK